MITLENISKRYRVPSGWKTVLEDTTLRISEPKNIGLLGRNGAGKSTLLRMISGTVPPDTGKIVRGGMFSWPLGFSGNFHGALSGSENVSFIAEIYGLDPNDLQSFVSEFSELGDQYYAPLRTYSSGMRARLAFGVSMAVEFDVYLIDEITEVGDARFKQKCRDAFRKKLSSSNLIITSHSEKTIRSFCDAALVLENGRLSELMPVDDAIRLHRQNMK